MTNTTIAANKATVDIFLAVNQDGDFHVSSNDAGEAIGELQDNFTCNAVRVVKIAVTVDLPQTETVSVAVTAPALSQAPAEVSVS